jgi:nickel-dependent lactate racemase
MSARVAIAYGRGKLELDLPCEQVSVIEPKHTTGLPDEKTALLDALKNPIGCAPLRQWLAPTKRICITFSDITRATPNDRIIPWLLEYLRGEQIRPDQITLLNGNGTHRANTHAELETLLTRQVLRDYRVLNHDCNCSDDLLQVGQTREGAPALLNRHFLQADVRIVTGFIEPHLFAGFSGGPKGIMPALAGAQTIMSNHGAANIGHPHATFGVTEGNPLWEGLRDVALLAGRTFLLNVSLNDQRQITGVFAGDLLGAHRVGIEFVRRAAMQGVDRPFEVVITTNSGYPLDLNLYQANKGMKAAAQIVTEGGTIIIAAECREGLPAGSHFEHLLQKANNSYDLLKLINTPGFHWPEQWAAQTQALVQSKADVSVYSSLPPEVVRRAHLQPCSDIPAEVGARLSTLGPKARVAVLPYGPLTIPYLQ